MVSQFEDYVPADGTDLDHAELVALADRIYSQAVAQLSSGISIAGPNQLGGVKIPSTGYLAIDNSGNLTASIGTTNNTANALVASNDARFATFVTQAALASSGYLTLSNSIGTLNGLTGNQNNFKTSNLADVTTTAPTTGQALVWNGTAYAPGTVSGGGSGGSLATLSDTNIISPQSGQLIQYSGGKWANVNNSLAPLASPAFTGTAKFGSELANQMTVSGGATGGTVNVALSGSDTNISLNLTAKGTGIIGVPDRTVGEQTSAAVNMRTLYNSLGIVATGGPGILYGDATGKGSLQKNFQFTPLFIPRPVQAGQPTWIMTVGITVTGVWAGIPGQTDAQTCTFTVNRVTSGGVVTQLGNAIVAGSNLAYTTFTPTAIPAGDQLMVQITAVTNGTLATTVVGLVIQPTAVYA